MDVGSWMLVNGCGCSQPGPLTTLRDRLIKIGAKVVRHAGYVVFQMAEVAVPRELFGRILERIGRLRLEPG